MLKKMKGCFVVVIALCSLIACSLGDNRPAAIQYDLGPLKTENLVSHRFANLPVIDTKVFAPEWMNEHLMFYRLDYINDQQVRFYTESSWNTSPARLFKNRLDAYLVRAGDIVSDEKIASPTLILRIDLEDFSQHFMSPSEHVGRIILRASLLKENRLIAQKRFQKEVVSLTADAQGGAKALAKNSDELIIEIMDWLTKTYRK